MVKPCSTKYDYDLLVIGCGPAGQRAAVQAAKLGKSVAIIDRREVVGGNCLNTGTIPSKSFKEAVLYLSGYRQRSMYGSGYRERNEIEMEDLTYRCNRIVQIEIDVIHNQLRRNNVEVLVGNASFIDQHTLHIENLAGAIMHKSAEYIIIAVGAQPFHPEHIDFSYPAIQDSDNILKIPTLPKSLAVVGGGIIGTEYGSMFAALGVHVTIIDTRDRLLGFIDRQITDTLQQDLKKIGVSLLLGQEVVQCAPTKPNQVMLKLKSGQELINDLVLISAGRRSATNQLGLEKIGVQVGERGLVLVNNHFQTSVANIYAAGDVIGFPALAATSSAQGRLATINAFGVEEKNFAAPLPFGIYAIPEISYIGLNEQELTERNIPYEVGLAYFKEIARGQIIGDENGLLKIIFNPTTEEILGIHIIGESATELIHIGQAVIALKGTLSYFRDTVFNYPTLAECYKVAALDGYNKIRKRRK